MKKWHGIQTVRERHRAQEHIAKRAGGDIRKYAQVVKAMVKKVDTKNQIKFVDISDVIRVAEDRKRYG